MCMLTELRLAFASSVSDSGDTSCQDVDKSDGRDFCRRWTVVGLFPLQQNINKRPNWNLQLVRVSICVYVPTECMSECARVVR